MSVKEYLHFFMFDRRFAIVQFAKLNVRNNPNNTFIYSGLLGYVDKVLYAALIKRIMNTVSVQSRTYLLSLLQDIPWVFVSAI